MGEPATPTPDGRAATHRLARLTVEAVLAPLDEGQRRIVELVRKHGAIDTVGTLAAALDVHPKTKSLLEGIGKVRERGLLTKGWPLQPTDVFGGAQ